MEVGGWGEGIVGLSGPLCRVIVLHLIMLCLLYI